MPESMLGASAISCDKQMFNCFKRQPSEVLSVSYRTQPRWLLFKCTPRSCRLPCFAFQMSMTTLAFYKAALSDGPEAQGPDHGGVGFSLQPERHVAQKAYDSRPAPSSKPGVCLTLVVVVVLALASTGACASISSAGSQAPVELPELTHSRKRVHGCRRRNRPSFESSRLQLLPLDRHHGEWRRREVKTLSVNVSEKFPHDTMAFTQGFEYANGVFYESTGLYGRTSLRKVDIDTGKVLQRYDFQNDTLFGEGITLHKSGRIFMLTWKAGRGFIFNQTTFEVLGEWKYEGQGWGLCTDRHRDEIYMSDGTTELRVLDPKDLSEKRRVTVTLRGKEVTNLNELEWICGEVWANVWLTNLIYRIDPCTGRVKSIINASNLPLRSDITLGIDVLNGIAFDRETGRLWFTGKLWPFVYQVSLLDDKLDLNSCT